MRSDHQIRVELTKTTQLRTGMVTFNLLQGVHQGMKIGSGQLPILLPFH